MVELIFDWKHIAFAADRAFTETYGFNGSQGLTHVEGVLIRPDDRVSRTLLVFMHPSSTLQLLPLPQALARSGYHVLCAGSRYQRNDTSLIMENVVLDLGAWIRAAREDWGYQKVVLCGWSGGGSLAMLYQSQAERPSITHTPAGDPVDIAGAGLIPADAVLSLAAHSSRALLLSEWLDPSVRNEHDPDDRDPALDLYAPGNDTKGGTFTTAFLAEYRAAQQARMGRITARVLEVLERLRQSGGLETERVFVTHRTMADPRFLDPSIDPNGRRPGWTYLGNPEVVNSGPVGLGRISTLRSWLSQWSPAHTRADSLRTGRDITVPFLAVECGADDAVPQPHTARIFGAVSSQDKTMQLVQGANHYFVNQPQELAAATELVSDWLVVRDFG
ncbi:alpha/beta hydrolase family protein [Pseudotabrizicola alkalilacus]|uniref:Alpha/beta hydrolase n=1 Tax=Pseudotabrizicola alkalilacus TaxID=2305252 RepID=A0A411Z024_9RHOB|nr:alpha/beta fold hydrolase [Pseudotabrizicola alkalilacus]RGP36407.1 alpha/beta hydrolase [Pseudotabrizicola alkalilacus]